MDFRTGIQTSYPFPIQVVLPKFYLYPGGQESHSLKPSMDFLGAIKKTENKKPAKSTLWKVITLRAPIRIFLGQEFPKALVGYIQIEINAKN